WLNNTQLVYASQHESCINAKIIVAFLHNTYYYLSYKEVLTLSTCERMKERRKELGYSTDYVAEKLNVNRSTVFRYESGGIDKLPIDILEPLSEILHTTPAYLMGWSDEKFT